MSRRIGLPASALVLCLMLGWASSSVADPPGTVITSCSYAALQDAVAGGGSIELQCGSQPTTISFPSPIVVGPTGNASITVASGQSVTLDGGGKSQIFKVEGGTLSLSHLKLSNGMALGTAGTAGPPGPAGSAGDEGESGEGGEEGQPGENGEEGGDGEDGEDGEKGSEGGEAQGGAIYIAAGSTVKISSSTFATDHAVGGAGGKGGNGGKGGAGGSGGDGGDGGGILGSQGLPGGTGGDGGDGGKGGDGGDGGDGGNAEGGAIYNAGTLEVSATKFNAGDYAQGGKGGGGGSGGRGSDAGDGGKGGRGGDAGAEGAHGADGAEPGRGGDTGAPGGGGGGGDGGEAFGGAIFNAASGSLEVLEGTSFTGDLAQGGAAGGGGGGGAGGGGASGGEGGWGGGGLNGGGETATTGGNGADGKDGGDGDTGADGGDGGGGGAAKGGAIASENSELTLDGSTTYSSNAALGGAAGSGGSGGEGGDGRSGGGGGWAGAAQCGFHEGKCASPGHSGRAGSGGNGGDGGDGGNGGAGSLTGGEAHGDDVYTPAGGSGGTQGPGGAGGAGGKPGSGGEAGRAGFGGGSEGGSDTEIIGGGEGSEGEAGEEGEPGTAGIGANVSPVPAPLLSATSPGSPSNKTTIKVLGSAEAGSAILVYANASCAGTPIGGGTAANLESPGILVLVPPNSTTLLYATATDDKGTSACSSPGLPFVQDSVPPETTIASGPAEGSTTNEATPSFALASSEEKSKFECALDGAEFASCKSPFKTPALSVGAHTLSVRAIDAAGNTDPTPAKRSFSYKPAGEQPHPSSPRPPKIGKHPGPKIETSGKKAKVKFSFVAHGSGTKYKCSLDNAPFRPCTSPVTYEVKPGKHSFRVEAIEAGAKPSKATSWKFTVAHKG